MAAWSVVTTDAFPRRITLQRLLSMGVEYFLPMIQKRRLEPLFPRYLFVAPEDNWREIKSTPGVHGVLLSDGRPATLPPMVIDDIKSRCDEDSVFIPPPRLSRGQRVSVESGPMRGMVGIYEGMSSSRREAALFSLLGRSVRADFREGSLVAA